MGTNHELLSIMGLNWLSFVTRSELALLVARDWSPQVRIRSAKHSSVVERRGSELVFKLQTVFKGRRGDCIGTSDSSISTISFRGWPSGTEIQPFSSKGVPSSTSFSLARASYRKCISFSVSLRFESCSSGFRLGSSSEQVKVLLLSANIQSKVSPSNSTKPKVLKGMLWWNTILVSSATLLYFDFGKKRGLALTTTKAEHSHVSRNLDPLTISTSIHLCILQIFIDCMPGYPSN